jgi:hypothetical protein
MLGKHILEAKIMILAATPAGGPAPSLEPVRCGHFMPPLAVRNAHHLLLWIASEVKKRIPRSPELRASTNADS